MGKAKRGVAGGKGVKGAGKREFKEGHIFVTAPAVGNFPEVFLRDMDYQAWEELPQPDEHIATIMIDDSKMFQTIEGFGGAFTDASATVFAKLPRKAQEAFLTACFDPEKGNAYNLCRTTIHSCDYAEGMYTYDDTPGDVKLKDFSIAADRKERIPFIKRAQKSAKGEILFFASPWSPPDWMKTNGEMKHGGKLKDEYRQVWADYFVKYIEAYEKEGIPMWGLTVQNEALAIQVWESCVFSAEEERDFVKYYLGPTLEKAGMGDVKIMIWDHNRGLMYQRVKPAFEDPVAAKYIWGTAFHWYTGDHFDNVRMVHDAFPDKHLLYTEGGIGGTWSEAFRLAKSVINDLQNWTEGWVVWNFILDEKNGPRHAGGPSRGATIVNVDSKTGVIRYNPPHWVFGNFSRFIKRGAKRIACTSNSDDLIATAVVNPDGSLVVVTQNLSGHEVFFYVWRDNRAMRFTAPPSAVVTVVMEVE